MSTMVWLVKYFQYNTYNHNFVTAVQKLLGYYELLWLLYICHIYMYNMQGQTVQSLIKLHVTQG